MNCESVREHLAEHLLSSVDPATDTEIRRHLRGCGACRQELAALAEGMSTFARAAHQVTPPAELKDRVVGVVREEARETPGRARRKLPARALAWAAALVVLAGTLAWAGVATSQVSNWRDRASDWRAEAAKYEGFLGALGGKDVRVGTLQAEGPEQLEGSFVMYDSSVGQSWVLVLVRAPGATGKARAVLSSGTSRIKLFPLRFDRAGEASTWLVTGSDISAFDRLRITDQTGRLLATGRVGSKS